MAKYIACVHGDFHQMVSELKDYISTCGLSMELKEEAYALDSGFPVAVLGFEKYFMRNSSRTSLTITVAQGQGNLLTIIAIGTGGGQGTFFNFSFGSESEIVNYVATFFDRYGE